MYERLLHSFKYDLDAGLEYATMELEERANYEKAEEITRRFVLDHHIYAFTMLRYAKLMR